MTSLLHLKTFLDNNAAISALIGDRSSMDVIPPEQDIYPAVTFSLDNATDFEHLGGRSNTSIDEISLDVYGDVITEVLTVAETLRSEMVGFRGAFGGVTAESIRLRNMFSVDPEPDTGLHRISVRLAIAYY